MLNLVTQGIQHPVRQTDDVLGEIAETVAAGQDPSPAQYFLYYQRRAFPLQSRLAAAHAELDELADAQYAAAICLMALSPPR